jgi:hypothetical protein
VLSASVGGAMQSVVDGSLRNETSK